jgi:hypothetical protein
LLRHRNERHTLCVEELDQAGKIGERAGQPVDLVDDHDVDAARPDTGEQALRRGSLEIAAREPAIVIAGSRQQPALVLLAANVGLAGFTLRRERVEFLLIDRSAGDGTAVTAAGSLVRTLAPSSGPFRRRRRTRLGEQILDVSIAERKAQVEPDRMLDDKRRKPVTTV